MIMSEQIIFLSCPKGLEEVLKAEVLALDLTVNKLTIGGLEISVQAEALQMTVMKAIMFLRVVNRVYLQIAQSKVSNAESIKALCRDIDWRQYFEVHQSVAIDFNGQSEQIRNTMFGAQCVKDGISDYFQQHCHARPNIDRKSPDIRLFAKLRKGYLSLYLDIAGKSLHQRKYRVAQGLAPLKENVASGLLLLAKWPEIVKQQGSLIDPFCGSGTFLIEAWQMATGHQPGLALGVNLHLAWKGFDAGLWQDLYSTVEKSHREQAVTFIAPIIGYDHDPSMIEIAKQNIAAAGLAKRIQVHQKALNQFQKPKHLKTGLVICNPPYGERLEDKQNLLPLYQKIGKKIKEQCEDWHLSVLTNDSKFSKAIGLKSTRQYKVKNGSIDCILANFEITTDNRFNEAAAFEIDKAGIPLLNRLKKNKKNLKNWRKQQKIESYRLYDADLVEFNVAIDVYISNDQKHLYHVQEYKAPKDIEETAAKKNLECIIDVLCNGLAIEPSQIFTKQRQRQKGKQQYQQLQTSNQKYVVRDGEVLCYVNLSDYLDTGLFLDHRRLRQQFYRTPSKKFLNLFCYTGVASLHAAKAGAMTTNVDLSKTYLNWAKDNYRLNHLTIKNHQFIHADVLEWLAASSDKYETIFCDPPSFSNSKRMEKCLDIQRDHIEIIQLCMKRLEADGQLYFSCNLKKFTLDEKLHKKFVIKNVTVQTKSKDFEFAKNTHHAFEIRHKVTV